MGHINTLFLIIPSDIGKHKIYKHIISTILATCVNVKHINVLSFKIHYYMGKHEIHKYIISYNPWVNVN